MDTGPPAEPFFRIDHVQLAMPKGEEERGRAFYVGVLGMREISKPATLAARGGAWFASGSVMIHLGVEEDFRPAKKAHPALLCSDYPSTLARLRSGGYGIREDSAIEGVARCYIDDPFGNRLELISGGASARL